MAGFDSGVWASAFVSCLHCYRWVVAAEWPKYRRSNTGWTARVIFNEELSAQTSLGMTSRYETLGQIPEPEGRFYFPVIQEAAGDNPRRTWIQLLLKKKLGGMFSISPLNWILWLAIIKDPPSTATIVFVCALEQGINILLHIRIQQLPGMDTQSSHANIYEDAVLYIV